MQSNTPLLGAIASLSLLSASALAAGEPGRIDRPGDLTQSAATAWQAALERGIARVLNPADYVCESPTALDVWVGGQVSQIDPVVLSIMSDLGLFGWAFDAKVLFDHDASDEYIGVDGEYTQRQHKTFKDSQRFWDVPNADILLMGAHGADILDDDLVYPLVALALGNPPQFVLDIVVTAARNTIEGGVVDLTIFDPMAYFVSPGIPGAFDNPMLSLNALAFSANGMEIFPGSGIIPDKIVMGEGLLMAMVDIGLGDKEAPDQILSHEFAHHVQGEIGAFEPGPATPEKTRRTELMADGFAAYYGSHARGNTFNARRFADVMATAYESGDCAFGNPGHHGTQLQRQRAAIWGQMVVQDAPSRGYIEPPPVLLDLFDAALPALVAPDVP